METRLREDVALHSGYGPAIAVRWDDLISTEFDIQGCVKRRDAFF